MARVHKALSAALWLCLLALARPAQAEDGYRLWLRYAPLADARWSVPTITLRTPETPMVAAAREELQRGLAGMRGTPPRIAATPAQGGIVLAHIDAVPAPLAGELRTTLGGAIGAFAVRATMLEGVPVTLIAAAGDEGLLYGSFTLLRQLQTGTSPDALAITERPVVRLRMLNHWDNPDGHVERGYAGRSIFDWWRLPGHVDQRMIDYARANAAIGINGTVVNNVNARAHMLSAAYIEKLAALADAFRPYGIRVFLSARFSAPRDIGGLKTADPLDPAVQAWWNAKADEIYAAIPDFGGFLVKANSEGQPGPHDYARTHADGANMLAAAVGDRGIVIWRAFVYAAENTEDRAKQAYSEFRPLDGRFARNVVVQVKNGAIDFQPREPFHPLFGAMTKTPLALELQITKEYLGFSTHLAYLGPLFEEALDADTFAKGRGSTVARVIDGSLDGHALSVIAGVANTGSDRNWSGSHFDQANWYAFGRLAWNPALGARDIAAEWSDLTFGSKPAVRAGIVDIMMRSRQAVVDYMTPLGLAHLMGTGHHYGPAPWVADLDRPEWNPAYYHRADRDGIGFDRTVTGSNAVAQYAPPVARRFASRRTVGDDYLLWFHRVGWDERLTSGRSLWEELISRYDRGVAEVGLMSLSWGLLAGRIDAQRHRDVASFLAIQEREARWWRDASIAYFASVSGRPLPSGTRPPAQPLAWYVAQQFPDAPGN